MFDRRAHLLWWKKKKEHVLIIRAGFGYTEFYDTRGYPDKLKPIFTDEFREKAKKILSQELNIDTMSLYNFRFHKEKRDTTAFSWNHSVNSRVIISPDSLSQNFMDVFIEGKKDIFELEAKEAQDIILEELLSNRLNRQFYFNNTVKTGDKVFVIKFKYIGQVYSNYIICSAESKKVVWDNCFSRITIARL